MENLHNAPESSRRCVGCGGELPGKVAPPGLCPKCLLKLAMETQPATLAVGTEMLAHPAPKPRGLPQPGDQFGQYRIVALLGAGGMGAVYDAQDLDTGRRVALKILSHALDSLDARERFFREGRLAASINHPNSVYIFGTEEIGGTPVIVMELVSGGTLQDRVRARGPLPIGEAVECVRQIVAGLEAAQRIGVLHRDIKPSNCYVAEDGTVKIGDFGLSISTVVRTEPALTSTGAFLGTPAFCSPEQMRGDELNIRSDMYSVGATLFFLLTGRTPFEGKTMVQLLATVLEEVAPSPRKFRPEIPQGLAKVVLRCLEKHSSDRFKSYAELAHALDAYSLAAPSPATLSLRCVAGIVDMTLLCSIAALINISVFGGPMAFLDGALRRSPKVAVCLLVWVFVATLYYALLEGICGAALGKYLCRLRVVRQDRSFPGIRLAWIRGVIFIIVPMVPYWLGIATNPKAYLVGSQLKQLFMGFSIYGIMGLLFVTARRRNGFSAVQDLLTRTRVISRAALVSRPLLASSETPPPMVESTVTIGPYHVLQALGEPGAEKWFLAYDLKLLRKVWLRVSSQPGPQVSPKLRNLARPGRLRWLSGRRTPEENWDAFEALSGRPFLEIVKTAQPWGDVRYWLHDLVTEISAAQADDTLPALALDRIWITAEGRAKLLDVAVPVLHPANHPAQSCNEFLNSVAVTALLGGPAVPSSVGQLEIPLPIHARKFLMNLPRLADSSVVAATLKPLLGRVSAVSRARRAVLVGGCVALPILAGAMGTFGLTFMRQMSQANPGLMQLNTVLQMRNSAKLWRGRQVPFPSDQQLEIYIAQHFRGLITNPVSWSNPMVVGMIKGESRTFAEKSLADHPVATAPEVADADAAVGPYLPKEDMFAQKMSGAMPVMILSGALLLYVGLPALLAAVLFRGGLVMLTAGVTYVRRDGLPASRLRLFWRALVVWGPLLPICIFSTIALMKHLDWQPWFALGVLAVLSAVSVALPRRGLQDLLAGTWPVPR